MLCILQSFNDYFNTNHGRLLSLWRTAVTFRRQFSELKATTDRELATLRADVTQLSHAVNSAFHQLTAQLHTAHLSYQVSNYDLLFTSHRAQLQWCSQRGALRALGPIKMMLKFDR